MSLTICDDRMTSQDHDTVADRISSDPELWIVSGRHGVYTRNQAISAMTVAEMRARKIPGPNSEILIAALEQELLVPVTPRDPWALLQTLKNAAAAVHALAGGRPEADTISECFLRIAETTTELRAAVIALGRRAAERATTAQAGAAHQWADAGARAAAVAATTEGCDRLLYEAGHIARYARDVRH